MAAAATRTPSRSSTHKAAGALLAHGRTRTDAPASPGANVYTQRARKNGRTGSAEPDAPKSNGQRAAQIRADGARPNHAGIGLRSGNLPAHGVHEAAFRAPHQSDGIRRATVRRPLKALQKRIYLPCPARIFSRGAGVCSICLHNLIYITNFINVNILNFQRFFRAFGCHNTLSITANRAASHAMRRIYIIQFT